MYSAFIAASFAPRLAMIVFPGPAFIVIPIGVAMLSPQFAWAQIVLDRGP